MGYLADNKQMLENAGLPADRKGLQQVLDKYPWFTTARILLNADSGATDGLTSLYLHTHPCPQPMLLPVPAVKPAVPQQVKSSEAIIDEFLKTNGHKIVPDEKTPEFDAAAQSSVLEVTDEMATEELAGIYMSQGMEKEAREIYDKLGIKPAKGRKK